MDDLKRRFERTRDSTELSDARLLRALQISAQELDDFLADPDEVDDHVTHSIASWTSANEGRSDRGSCIRYVRDVADVSQSELSEAAGVNRFSISKWERGDVEPSGESIMSVWQATVVDRGLTTKAREPKALQAMMAGDLERLRELVTKDA